MPNIGDQDWGPRGQELPWMETVRSDLGQFTNRTWLDSNQDIPVNVLDYIGQYAATWAIQNALAMQWNGPRCTHTAWARGWIVGFVAWYLNPGNAAIRDDVARQPNFLVTAQQGLYAIAQKEYRNIPWTFGDFIRADSLWFSTFQDASLERVNMNLMNCTVDQWKVTPLRAPMIGSLWLPSQCTYRGLKLELGDEILSDWLSPPDASHGHPFTTLCNVYSTKTDRDWIQHRNDTPTRKSYSVIVIGGRWRIVIKDGVPPCVITFFKDG